MRRTIFLGSFTLAFLFFQGWFLFLTFHYPINGIKVEQDAERRWVVRQLEKVSVASQVDIQVGDIVKFVNGIQVEEYPTIIRWKSIDQASSITIQRDNHLIETDLTQTKHIMAHDILALAAEACSLLIAYLIFQKTRSSKSAFYLALVFGDIGLTFMSLGASIRGDLLGKAQITTCIILLPMVFYQFIAVFLQEKGGIKLPIKFLAWVYWAALGLFVFQLLSFLQLSAAYTIYRITVQVAMSMSMLGILFNLAVLFAAYFKHRGENPFISLVLKTVSVSLFLSLAPITILSFMPQIFFGREWVHSFYTSWFIFILPLTFAYLIIARKLYDIDMIVRRILFTALIALFPSAVFTGLIRLLFPNDSSSERLTIIFMLFVASLTFILYSLEHLATMLEPVMFPRKYRLKESLKNIAKNLGTISSLREMKDIILVDIIHTLEVNGSAIVFQYKEDTEWFIEGLFDQTEAEKLMAGGPACTTDYTIFEINKHEEYTSYLIISERKNRTRLTTEEVQWVNLIMTYLAVCLENMHLLRKLTVKLEQFASQIPDEKVAGDIAWFRKLMFDLQEKERSRIATDLHDTTMQDLFFLKDRLRNLVGKYPFYSADRTAFEGLMDYIDIIHSNLRQSCFELHPYLLKETGLVHTVQKLIEMESVANPFEIKLSVSGTLLLERRNLDTKRHLFRLIQELINNAKKHSQASLIRISLSASAENILLEYRDDGIGFNPEALAPREIGGKGIGLEQMKSRILSLGGSYHLKTEVGNGMRFTVTIPIK